MPKKEIKENETKKDCFIIMPITTPDEFIREYGDSDHFTHVLECLFTPALDKAGFNIIPPKSTGSDIIHAEIIDHLSKADLVLCDMSILNPNVFFEFGIRTALDKPVALVVDEITVDKVPFDTSIINYYKYDSSLAVWTLTNEIEALAEHARTAYSKSNDRNSLWKYFGITHTGEFKPEATSLEDKVDLLTRWIRNIEQKLEEFKLDILKTSLWESDMSKVPLKDIGILLFVT